MLKEKILVARSIEESEKVRVGLASSLRKKRAAADGTSDQFPGPLGFTNSFITTGLIVQPTCLHTLYVPGWRSTPWVEDKTTFLVPESLVGP